MAGRDHWLDEETQKQRSTATVEWMGAEDPLFWGTGAVCRRTRCNGAPECP